MAQFLEKIMCIIVSFMGEINRLGLYHYTGLPQAIRAGDPARSAGHRGAGGCWPADASGRFRAGRLQINRNNDCKKRRQHET